MPKASHGTWGGRRYHIDELVGAPCPDPLDTVTKPTVCCAFRLAGPVGCLNRAAESPLP
jgi:hypothetical protein